MASTDCYKVNIHSYRFCVSYIGDSVSRVGPTRTAYSIFILQKFGLGNFDYFSKLKFGFGIFFKLNFSTLPVKLPTKVGNCHYWDIFNGKSNQTIYIIVAPNK